MVNSERNSVQLQTKKVKNTNANTSIITARER